MHFRGANPQPRLDATDRLPGHSNYILGNDPSRWLHNIPQFSRVRYHELYPGVDLDFYGMQGRLEYDFEVYPGADPAQIELGFSGARDLRIDKSGDLVIGINDQELRFRAPHVYQQTAGGKETVKAAFVLRDKDRVAFELGDYDRGRTLVIDPVLSFSTYLGGSGQESCAAVAGATFVPQCPGIAVDSASRIYIAGVTTSTGGWPTPSAPATTIPPGGSADVFIARVSNSGLDYLTFIGGSAADYPAGIGVDSGFNVYVAGTTTSADYPVVNGAQTSAGSASSHVFVTKIDSSGSVNDYSTYLSSAGTDTASGMALDSQGRVYVIGTTTTSGFPTTTSTFPITAGALQATAGAASQFFFAKLNPAISGPNSLLYSTFIGGSNPANGVVLGGAVAVDSSFNVYLAGGTSFTDMPVVNAYQGTEQGGVDVWAAKLTAPATNTEQYTPVYETYFGGGGNDVAYGVASDGTDTLVTGSTTSSNITIPTGTAALQGSYAGGTDAFLAKFGVPTTTGTTQGSVPLAYFTYLGGGGLDVGLAIIADSSQNPRIVGLTSGGLPNPAPISGSSGGGTDAFLARIVFNTTSTSNSSSTSILGGSGTDIGTSTAVDGSLNSYVGGETASGNFPLANAVQGNLAGSADAFVSKLAPNTTLLSFVCNASVPVSGPGCPSPAPANPTVSPSPVGVGNKVTFVYSIYNQGDPATGVVFTDSVQGTNSQISSVTTSSGTCSSPSNNTVTCNMGTINTSTTSTATPPVTAVATTVTVTVLATAPTSTGVIPPKPPDIGNIGTLTVPGTNFVPVSRSGTATVNDFGLSATAVNSTVTAGATATYNLTVTPTGPFPESVSLGSCSGLPAGASCSVAQNPINNLNNGPQSRTLDISTTARVTTPASLIRKDAISYALWLPLSGLALIGSGLSRRRSFLLGLLLAVVLGVVFLQAGCGSSSNNTPTTNGTPAGTYTVTINATSGSATRTTAVTLVVQ
jgi:hypothetical protein